MKRFRLCKFLLALTVGTTLGTSVMAKMRYQLPTLPEHITPALKTELDRYFEDEDSLINNKNELRERIENVLSLFGYYHSIVDIDTANEMLTIKITLNEPVRITQISFTLTGEGARDPLLKNLSQYTLIKTKDIFEHQKYELGKEILVSKAHDKGYLKANFSQHEVNIDLDALSAEVILSLDTGPLHYFHQTDFNQYCFKACLLKRYVPYQVGDRYDTQALIQLQDGLLHSQYFKTVQVEPKSLDESNQVDVNVQLTPAKPNHYQLGIGYGTDTGARGLARWNRRFVNDYGHKFSFGFNVSEVNQTVDTLYTVPGKRPATDRYQLRASYDKDEYNEKPAEIFEAEIREERELFGWRRRLSLIYLNEKDENLLLEGKRHTVWLLPSLGLHKSIRNDQLNPTHGKSIDITLKAGYETSDNNKSFLQPGIALRWLHATSDKTSWLLRGEMAATIPDKPERLPLSQRLFAGGDYSIRGFGYRSLPNVIDADGTRRPVGGGYLGIISIEGRRLIYEPFGIHAFVDAGNAFRNVDDRVEVGIGAGFHYRSRLGPLKVSLAQPLTKGADSLRLHVQFGAEL